MRTGGPGGKGLAARPSLPRQRPLKVLPFLAFDSNGPRRAFWSSQFRPGHPFDPWAREGPRTRPEVLGWAPYTPLVFVDDLPIFPHSLFCLALYRRSLNEGLVAAISWVDEHGGRGLSFPSCLFPVFYLSLLPSFLLSLVLVCVGATSCISVCMVFPFDYP